MLSLPSTMQKTHKRQRIIFTICVSKMITSRLEPSKKNIVFPVMTEYGELEITINLSKPEKIRKEIAAQRAAAAIDYPKCLPLFGK